MCASNEREACENDIPTALVVENSDSVKPKSATCTWVASLISLFLDRFVTRSWTKALPKSINGFRIQGGLLSAFALRKTSSTQSGSCACSGDIYATVPQV